MRNPNEVWKLWESAVFDSRRTSQRQSILHLILGNLQRYAKVAQMIGCPAWVIAVIHYRESDFNFTTWLANGDPLMHGGIPAKTIHVPKGLGPAPDWEEAAMMSLRHQGWVPGMEWDLVSALIRLEGYNGWGYYNHGVQSPYVWSGTNHYFSGKYARDGVYDPAMIDAQLGCAALAMGLKIAGIDLQEKRYV